MADMAGWKVKNQTKIRVVSAKTRRVELEKSLNSAVEGCRVAMVG